jgi:hypothetical protein
VPIPVVADADTLFGGTTRGLLIYLDYMGLVHLHCRTPAGLMPAGVVTLARGL